MQKLFSSPVIFFIFIFSVYFLISGRLLLTDPPPWSDEAIYADVAINWLHNHRIATELWKDMIPGVEKFAAWNLPGHFLTTALLFQVFGETLFSQRLLSFSLGLLSIFLILNIARLLMPKAKSGTFWLLATLLLTDYQFMQATRIARPEISVIFFGIVSWWLILKWRTVTPKLSTFKSGVVGFIAGSAVLFHPLGISMAGIGAALWLIETWKKQTKTIRLLPYLIGAILPLGVSVILLHQYWPIFLTQFQLASLRKYMEEPWIIVTFKMNFQRYELAFVLLALIIAWLIALSRKNGNIIGRWLVLLAVIFSSLTFFGRLIWYTAYALPFIYIALVYYLQLATKKQRYPYYLMGGLIIVNFYMTWKNSFENAIPTNAYQQYCSGILKSIPDKTVVFISAAPDPYYCFMESHRQNRLIEFPVFVMPTSTYTSVLDQVDYVIFQKSYDQVIFGDFLKNYISANTINSTYIRSATNVYKTQIYELKHGNK